MSTSLVYGDVNRYDKEELEQAKAALPHSSVASPRATHREPELHGPSVVEKELGTDIQDDVTEEYGHPGVPCEVLPKGHAHRLPARHDVAPHSAAQPGGAHGVYGSGGIAGGDAPEEDQELHGRQDAARALSGGGGRRRQAGRGSA